MIMNLPILLNQLLKINFMITAINKKEFNSVVIGGSNTIPILVKFTASWCKYCTEIKHIIEEISVDMERDVKFVEIDFDENQNIFQRFNVKEMPTLVLFFNGYEENRLTGGFNMEVETDATIKEKITNMIKETLE